MMNKYGLAFVAGIGLAVSLGNAHAAPVTAASGAIVIQNTVTTATTGLAGNLVGKVTLSNFTFSSPGSTTTFTMTVLIQNLTSAALVPSGRLTAFAFNTTPEALSVSDNSGVFDTYFSSNFPSVGTVDVCASTGNTCAGGGGGDLAPGASNSFTLTLTGLPDNSTSIDLGAVTSGAAEIFDFKWQTSIGSFESQCTYGTTCGGGGDGGGGGGGQIPEPASMILLGTGLLALRAFAGRRATR